MSGIQTSISYEVLRRGGVSPTRASRELGLEGGAGRRLERLFLGRQEPSRPKFARHAAHVAAVTAAGGYPSLVAERAR